MDIATDPLLRLWPWALGLILGFPLTMVALGELGTLAARAGWPISATIRGVRRLVVPALALTLFVRFVLELPPDHTVTRVTATIFWIAVLLEALTFINEVVFLTAAEGSWQSRVPTLFRDIIRFVLVGIGAALIYSEVWGEEIGAAWAALGLGSVVIGLALQEPVGNIVSGLILLAERPLAQGDWIIAEGVTGQVVAINWRSVHLWTPSLELKIIPNSSLYRGSFSNLSRPDLTRAETLVMRFSAKVPPNRVKNALLDCLQSIALILKDPPPEVIVGSHSYHTIIYNITFYVARQEDVDAARDIFLSHAWYVARRERLNRQDDRQAGTLPERAIDLLQQFPQFRLSEQLRQEFAPQVEVRCYGAGERIISEGGALAGFYVVISGAAVLSTGDGLGTRHELARVGPGEYFGETILAGHPNTFTATALADTDIIILDPELVHRLLDASPRLARDIGAVLDVRRTALQGIRRLSKERVGSQPTEARLAQTR